MSNVVIHTTSSEGGGGLWFSVLPLTAFLFISISEAAPEGRNG